MATPTGVSVLLFQVGFGDCLLLRFHYPGGGRRHVLIDFGSFPKASWLKDGGMRKVAEAIRNECGGKLEGLVATHRHADHISGFTTEQDDPGSVIAGCEPDVVVLPWTEDPDARTDATAPTAAFMASLAGAGRPAPAGALERGRAFVASLDVLEPLWPVIAREVATLQARGGSAADLAEQLAFHGENGLSNRSAVKNLLEMGARSEARYVFHGADSGLEAVLPGVGVKVLGPPTLEQTRTIKRYAASAPHEYWLTLTHTALRLREEGAGLFPDAGAVAFSKAPAYARWLIARLRSLRGRHLLEIVRTLDGVLNNTSVILLFEVAGRKLLFPGDAQLENWTFALEQAGVGASLQDVDFYKVGHHGSLNATPRTALWENFSRRGPARELKTAMSTLPGVHGGKHGKPTEVPRTTLVTALESESTLTSTEEHVPRTPGGFAEVRIDV